ncbi:MAG: hypothetical protein PHU25_20940 [Deltaproteobacteria bacterium]|nr:hypothetical protein [Deltaproteobacteria bacterium]
MKHNLTTLVPAFLLFLLPACSGCSGNGKAKDSGTDASSDADSDTDTDSDADTDSYTGPTDAGPWIWSDNPQGEDCGPGCTQLTFSEEVEPGQWDVWDKYLVYRDEDTRIWAVDIVEKKHMRIPDPHPEYPVGFGKGSLAYYPTAQGVHVYYGWKSYYSTPRKEEVIKVDLAQKTQEVVSLVAETSGNSLDYVPRFLDASDSHVVSQAGCGDGEEQTLCLFDVSTMPAKVSVLINDGYGNYNSIWNNVFVFTDSRPGLTFDITGYDIGGKAFFPVTNDAEYTQAYPRIQGDRVVYVDLKFGTNQDAVMGDWNHAAIFVYDMKTKERPQVTSGDWTCVAPDIWNEIVVWADYRDCNNPNNGNDFSNVQVWGYNLDTKKEFRITNLPTAAYPERPKEDPRVWGYKVFVDMMKPAGGTAIYMFDLPEGVR